MERVELGHALTLKSVALAGLLGWGATAFSQTSVEKTVPDAQVEANVLKALAGTTDLANQPITTTTVYGIVTLSGSVQTEALRTEAETIASRTSGVKKVVDEMTLTGDATKASVPTGDDQAGSGVPQSDATAAEQQIPQRLPEPSMQGSPDSNNTQAPRQVGGPSYGPAAAEHRQPYGGGEAPPAGYPQQGGDAPQQAYSQPPGYPQQPGYPPHNHRYNGPPQPEYGGQAEGLTVTVPIGSLVRIRINQSLDSSRTLAGTTFDGVVVNDVVADGAGAIPRGATVHGTVLDVLKSGALKGRGELSLQLTQVTLAGKNYPLTSDVWTHNGSNKTTDTVNRTAIGGGIGALIGAAAGGGAGAAIGAGVGGALGLGSSAASGDGQVYVPAEGLLTFHLVSPATMATVSQQEMNRLAQGVPMGSRQPPLRQRYPNLVYAPGYYRAYPAYPYPPYPYPY